MNILILTSTHAMDVAETIDTLYNNCNEHNNLYSVQAFALLAEETLEQKYIPTFFTYAAEVRKKPGLVKFINGKNTIVFGNIDKNTKIKFDHIIGVKPNYSEGDVFDPYLQDRKDVMDEVFTQHNVKPIEWFTPEDCDYIFPSLHHLLIFLKKLGVKFNDTVQS